MLVKATTVFALLGALTQFAVATPPACVIGAISTQKNPRDISSVCGSADSIKSYLATKCGSNQQVALNYFSGVCSDAGVTVSTDLPSSSTKSVSSTSTGSSRSTGATASAIPGTNDSVSSSTTGSSSSSPSGTMSTSVVVVSATASVPAASASASRTGSASRLGSDAMGLAAVGILGAMLAL